MAGDALLVEFPSAVNALRWAMDVQRAARSRQTEMGPALGLSLRIGINVEDVIVDDGVLQGDGVNIAARIHQAAEPGQIVVTAAVRDYVSSRLPVTFHDLGTPPLKNIIASDAGVWGRVVRMAAGEATPQPYIQWSTRPTIAVLPFRNIGGTEADSYFGEGITEDIITGLSRNRSLYVIARNSTLRYRDRSKDLRQIAGELDVRYVLDGSVRRHGNAAAHQFRADRRGRQPADLGAAFRRHQRQPVRVSGPHRRQHRRLARAARARRRGGQRAAPSDRKPRCL